MPDGAPAGTPRATRALLVATLSLTAVALAVFVAHADEPMRPRLAARFLWLFGALFLVRVVGQIYVRARRPRWLPPPEEWNLMPYRYLLPAQLVILVLMAWVALDLSREAGVLATPRPTLGRVVLAFSGLYASAMAVRYVMRMTRRPEQRWFGGAIPIVFHLVIASFLFVVGTYHARS